MKLTNNQSIRYLFIAAGLLLLLTQSLDTKGQEKEMLPYNVWIKAPGATDQVKGILYEVKDSSLVLVNGLGLVEKRFVEIPVGEIDIIRLRKQKKVIKSTTVGVAAGGGFGLVVGAIAATDWYGGSGEGALLTVVSGIFYGAVGALIGSAVGATKKRINIGGDMAKFDNHRNDLRYYSYRVIQPQPDPSMTGITDSVVR